MAYWLLKSEASTWSWADQVRVGENGTPWDGVRNHLAKKNLSRMREGDLAFFYHSRDAKEIVGVVAVVREGYPDPTSPPETSWVAVDVAVVHALPRPVTLSEMRLIPALKDMDLLVNSRLSVQCVTPQAWRLILDVAGSALP